MPAPSHCFSLYYRVILYIVDKRKIFYCGNKVSAIDKFYKNMSRFCLLLNAALLSKFFCFDQLIKECIKIKCATDLSFINIDFIYH